MHKILQDLADAVINGDEKATEKQAQEALAEGIDPIEAIKEGLMKGMEVVGDRFQKFDIFLPQVARVVGAIKSARATSSEWARRASVDGYGRTSNDAMRFAKVHAAKDEKVEYPIISE